MEETGVLAVLSPYLAGLLEGSGAPTTPLATLADAAPRSTVRRVEYDDEDPVEHDPDDPDEPDDDEPVNGEPVDSDDDDADEAGDEDVDTEEEEWRRVWADDRAGSAPPARPSQVKLSYLGGAEL